MAKPGLARVSFSFHSSDLLSSVYSEDIASEFTKAHCLYCSQDFQSHLTVQAHLASHIHPSLETMRTTTYLKRPRYRCATCTADVFYHEDITRHSCFESLIASMERLRKRFSRYGAPNYCLICGSKCFESGVHLLFHLIVHHAQHDDHTACPICGAEFKSGSKEAMEEHCRQIHVPQQVFQERLKRSSYRKDSHQVFRRFLCLCSDRSTPTYGEPTHNMSCGQTCSNMAQLCTHVICTHSVTAVPSRPKLQAQFNCYYCRVGFPHKDDLYLHMISKHELQMADRMKSLLSVRGFEAFSDPENLCYFCWFSFQTHEELQAHIVSSHCVESWRICGLCGHDYGSNVALFKPQLWWIYLRAHERHHSLILRKHANETATSEANLRDQNVTYPEKFSFFARIRIVDSRQARQTVVLPVSLSSSVAKKLKQIGHHRAIGLQ